MTEMTVASSGESETRFVERRVAVARRRVALTKRRSRSGDPEPHLTIAAIGDGDDVERVASRARREFAAGLPLRFVVDCVALLEECNDGTWRESARFALA